MVVSVVLVNGNAMVVADGGFLAAPVGLAFDDQFVGGGDEPVDGGLGEQRVGHHLTVPAPSSASALPGRS